MEKRTKSVKLNKNMNGNLHKGHRQRLKSKALKNGLKSLSKHEILELMLTYTIPQKDTNELAHKLINSFFGFSNVFEADYNELLKQNGVGKETALFLTLLPQLFEIYKQDKQTTKQIKLKDLNSCLTYFRNNYEISSSEKLYIFCINNLYNLVDAIEINGNSDSLINVDPKTLISKILNSKATGIIMMHTHPHGDSSPSYQDVESTLSVMYVCKMFGINFYDHIILTETEYFSMGHNAQVFETFAGNSQHYKALTKEIAFMQNPDFTYNNKKGNKHE